MSTGIRILSAVGLIVPVCLSAPRLRADSPLQTLLLSGDPAPGIDPPTTIQGFTGRFDSGPDTPLLEMVTTATANSAGQVVFWGRLAGGINVDYDADGDVDQHDLDALVACAFGPAVPLIDFNCLDRDLDHDGDVDSADFACFQRCYSGANVPAMSQCTDMRITTANDSAVWAGVPGELVLVAREGSQAPGAPEGVVFDYTDWGNWDIPAVKLNAAGQLAMVATLGGPGVTRENGLGIWMGPPSQLQLIARAGDPLPGMPLGEVAVPGFRSIWLNDAGQIAFITGFDEAGGWGYEHEGLWTGLPGDLHLLLRTGDLPPGFDEMWLSSLGWLALNNSGLLAVTGWLYGHNSGTGDTWTQVLWSNTAGEWAVVAQEGGTATGTAPGVTFLRRPSSWDCFGRPLINEAGQIAFEAWLGNAGPEARGIWLGTPDELQLVMWTGAPPPEVPADARLRWLWIMRTLNDTRQITVAGELEGPGIDRSNNHAVWFGDAGGLQLLAREGDPAPGTPPGTVFGVLSVSDDEPFWSSLNPAGGLVLSANLRGVGITDANDFGVWTADCHGQLHLLVREGQELEVRPGDYRTIARLHPGEGNDLGQLPFWARFSDGSEGVFLTGPHAVQGQESREAAR